MQSLLTQCTSGFPKSSLKFIDLRIGKLRWDNNPYERMEFKSNKNVQEIIKKLNSTLGSVEGFDLNVDDAKKNSATFKLRKRVLYAFQTIFLNRIVVNGTVYKASADNESDVKISFTQDFLAKLILSGYIISGLAFSLIAVISGIETNIYMFIAGVFVLILGVAFWFDVKRRFEKNI